MRLTNADVDVLRGAEEGIRTLQGRMGIAYADLFSPLAEEGLRGALRRLTIHARGEPLGTGDLEVVSPPVYGRYALLYSTDVDADRQAFALRHGMAHVVCGHVSAPTYMSDREDWMRDEERVADLFALADLFPAHVVESLRDSSVSWAGIRAAVAGSIAAHTIAWPEGRVADRAALRVALYRRSGL